MITEIGIVIGLYILTRLVPASRTRFVTVLSGVTMLVTLVVIADLVTRGFTSNSLYALVKNKTERDEPKEKGIVAVSKVGTTTITRADGGSITTPLGYGIAVAKDSSLNANGLPHTTQRCRLIWRERPASRQFTRANNTAATTSTRRRFHFP